MDPSLAGKIAAGLALTNLTAFGLFWVDKRRARDGGWRITERTLLTSALFGGLGAWLGQQRLRHKTRKEPFRSRLGFILALHVSLLVAAAVMGLRNGG